MPVITDREQMLQWQQAQKLEAQAVDQMTHYAAVGYGLAEFCQGFYDTLIDDEVKRFSREEILQLLTAAVQGR